MTKHDLPYVMRSWMECHRDMGPSEVRRVSRDMYFAGQRRCIEWLLDRPATTVLIAHDLEDESNIYGFMVHDLRTLHYVYVKLTWRRLGVASRLMDRLPETVERYSHYANTRHASNPTDNLLAKRPLAYDFYAFYRPEN